jgi:N-(2-amino-2-carboxyethyl)-L-glutamate synthase
LVAQNVFEAMSADGIVVLPGYLPDATTYVKLEGLNPAGSIKIKSAMEMVNQAELAGLIGPGTQIIESSSGNLGVALATICAARGYRLTIVTDPNANDRSVRFIRALGAEVVVIDRRDAAGGFLQSRIDEIHRQLEQTPDLLWLNQYANPANAAAHEKYTATELFEQAGIVPDWLFVGAGTTGTLMGCLSYVRAARLPTVVVAVDTCGSVLFSNTPGRRYIPGLGASRRPELLADDGTFPRTHVEEIDTIHTCRRVAREYGLLLGGSSGTVLAAISQFANRIGEDASVVAISPDMGYGYLDTIYDDRWVMERFGVLPAVTRPTTCPA